MEIDTNNRPPAVVIEQLIAAAAARGYPDILSIALRRRVTGRDGWLALRAIPLVPTELAALARELDEHDVGVVAAAARARRRQELAPIDPTAPETIVERGYREEREAAAERARATPGGQAEAVAALLEDIKRAVVVPKRS